MANIHIFKFITTQKSIITAQNSERASELETTPAQMVLVCKTRIRQAKPRGGAAAPTAPPLATSLLPAVSSPLAPLPPSSLRPIRHTSEDTAREGTHIPLSAVSLHPLFLSSHTLSPSMDTGSKQQINKQTIK